MKVTSILFGLAVGLVSTGTVLAHQQHDDAHHLKRAADAAADALAEALPSASCADSGEACAKAKRAAVAVEEAIYQARAAADPSGNDTPYLSKRTALMLSGTVQKRSADSTAEGYTLAIKRAASAAADAFAEAYPEADPARFCSNRGEACGKFKQKRAKFCSNRGEACGKAKRAADAFADAVNDQLEAL